MAKITAITKQQDRERVSVFIDDKYSFSLNLDQLVECKLKNGQEITKAEVTKFKQLSDYGKLLEKAIGWALRRPHSIKELENYLYRKQVEPANKHRIIEYLTVKNYVNDQDFVKFWVESRIRSKKPSKRALISELRLKGIDNSLIEQALNDLSFDEEQMLDELITKKSRLSKYKDQQKLKEYLLRQGFSYDLINQKLQ